MEIVIELPQDINKLCRTCMSLINEGEVTNSIADERNEICKMLRHLTSMKVTAADGLPILMCDICVDKLQSSYLFKEQCERAYLNYREFLFQDDENLEKCEDIIENIPTNEDFVCSVCLQNFPSQYKLCKHEIEHNNSQNLLTRFLNARGDTEDSFGTKPEIDPVVVSLVLERKESHDQMETVEDTVENVTSVDKEMTEQRDEIPDETAEITEADKTNSSEGIKMCDLCDRIFSSDLSLSLHFITHALIAESITDPDIFNQYLFCGHCGETFDTKDDLEEHLPICCLNTGRRYECIKCALAFDSEVNLLKHEKYVAHNEDYIWDDFITKSISKDTFGCPVCNENFTNKQDLQMHSVTHVIKRILCRICKKFFCSQLACNVHLGTHPNYKHECKMCGKFLGSKHALKMHVMGIHSVTKNFVCSICSKAFKTPSRLYIHNLIHKEDKKFVCSYCAYRTNNVGDFRVHNRIHTSERPYKCSFVNCSKRFKTSSHLNEHVQRHLQIKKYQCSYCQMVFGHSHTLKMHTMVHTGEKPFICTTCNVRFRRKHHLKNHMKQHVIVDSAEEKIEN